MFNVDWWWVIIPLLIVLLVWVIVKITIYYFNKLLEGLPMDKLIEFVKEARGLIQELNTFVDSGNLEAVKEVINDIQGTDGGNNSTQ